MKVLLKDVRISFISALWEPEQYQGKGAFRHSATFLTVPGSANDKAIWDAIKAVAAEKFEKKAPALLESMKGNSNKFCYMNGDTKDYDGYQGMFYLAGHRKQTDGAPLVMNANKSPLTAESGILYGGCYVNASVDIYAQAGDNPGIRCGLIAVQFLRKGDSFGGASRSNGDEFENLGEGADADFDGAGEEFA